VGEGLGWFDDLFDRAEDGVAGGILHPDADVSPALRKGVAALPSRMVSTVRTSARQE
jgi:hypothetical protein